MPLESFGSGQEDPCWSPRAEDPPIREHSTPGPAGCVRSFTQRDPSPQWVTSRVSPVGALSLVPALLATATRPHASIQNISGVGQGPAVRSVIPWMGGEPTVQPWPSLTQSGGHAHV